MEVKNKKQALDLAEFMTLREWVAAKRGGPFIKNFAAADRFCRKHRAALVKAGVLLVIHGAGSYVHRVRFETEVLRCVIDQSN